MTITADASSDAELARRSARLRLPTWLGGGDPLEFGRMCRWRMEATDPAVGEWDVSLDERVRRRPGRIVQVNRLATKSNADAAGAYSRLSRLPTDAALFRGVSYEHVQAELDRMGSERAGGLALLMSSVTLAMGTAAPDQLAAIVQQVLRDYLLPILPEAACGRRAREGTSPSSTQRADSSATPALGWAPTSRRSSWRCPRGCGQRPRSGLAAWSSTRSAAR